MNSFQELQLPASLQKALQAMAFEKPTPVQAQAIPVAMLGKDLIACAQTGTGKTAAFSIPTLIRLLQNPGKTALVLAPTRELADQINAVWTDLAKFTPGMHSTCLIGGQSMAPQIRSLRKNPRLIVATPGRLVDHMERGTVSLGSLSVLILDEADRMLDMGFAPQLARIMKYVPKVRQTLLFSATLPPHIENLAKKYLNRPERIAVGQISQAARAIAQTVIHTTHQEKNETLLSELSKREGSVLVFTRTKSRTDRLAKFLIQRGHSADRIHGGRSQGQRTNALADFKNGETRILVATDIAARGIDISHIAHVINFDLPQVAEDYIHRIGRTARAGNEGNALSLVSSEEKAQWREITRLLSKTGSSAPQSVGLAQGSPRPSPQLERLKNAAPRDRRERRDQQKPWHRETAKPVSHPPRFQVVAAPQAKTQTAVKPIASLLSFDGRSIQTLG